MADETYRVILACERCYHPVEPCNWFVQAVAKDLSIPLPGPAADGNADTILTALGSSGAWETLTRHQAVIAAGEGRLIIAGLQSSQFAAPTTHGHVCIVVKGGLVYSTNSDEDLGGYGKSRRDQRLDGWVFTHTDALNVQYFAPLNSSLPS